MRIVAGAGSCVEARLADVACRVRDHARVLGFRINAMRASRCRNSPSRYLHLRCPAGLRWVVRVSNHHRPANTGHENPHLDLVTLDGRSGFVEACGWLGRVAAGGVDWFDPMAGVRQPRRRR